MKNNNQEKELEKEVKKTVKKVLFTRKIIKSGYFNDEQITVICGYLGFSDTAFRDKNNKHKLNDFLLDTKYWIERKNRQPIQRGG